jgi:hypothetical protein
MIPDCGLGFLVQETPDHSDVVVQLDPIASLQLREWFAAPAPVIHLKDSQADTQFGVLLLQVG